MSNAKLTLAHTHLLTINRHTHTLIVYQVELNTRIEQQKQFKYSKFAMAVVADVVVDKDNICATDKG